MKVSFGTFFQSYGRQEAEIPDMPSENVADYIRDHFDQFPLPEGDYIMGSNELDEESIEIEE